MKTLFVKLFIAFLLAMLISGVVFFTLAFQARDWLQEQRHPEITQQQHRNRMPPPPDFRGMNTPPVPRGPHRPLPPPFLFVLGAQTMIFLVVGGGICYLLAWRITAPVRKLREAVQRLADGDLTARTGIAGGQSGDEMSELR